MIDDCARVESLLVRAAEGALTSADEARLRAHLEQCASCRAELDDQRAMREMLQGYPVEGAGLGFDTRVMAAVRAESEARESSWLNALDFRRWTWRLVPVAAVLALLSVTIARTDTATEETTVAAGTNTDSLPVSSALWSESVSESSLLSLMLTANVDDALSNHRKDQ